MPSSTWGFLGKHQNKVIAHDEARGIMMYRNGNWELLIKKQDLPTNFYITSICDFAKGTSILTTSKNGLYTLSESGLTPLKINGIDNNQHFTSVVKIDELDYLIGTYNNGSYVINESKDLIESFSKEEGLQNNNIRSLFVDKSKNIWMGLNNGISFIPYNNAIKNINPSVFRDGSGYSMAIFNKQISFASSNGIFEMPLENIKDLSYSKNRLRNISEGQTWKLGILNNKLYAGKEDGLYETYSMVVKKTKEFKKAYKKLLDYFGISLTGVASMANYALMLPLIPIMKNVFVSGNFEDVDLDKMVKRLIAIGVTASVAEVIKKLATRISKL
jgi:hypothetical protein